MRFLVAALALTATVPAAALTKATQPVDAIDLLKHEVRTLQGEKDTLQDDKQMLLKTVQQVLKGNQTREDILRKQVDDVARAKALEEQGSAQERAALEARVKKAEETAAARKEVLQSLQDENVDLKAEVHRLSEELAGSKKKVGALTYDKQHLMQAMHNLLRANAEHTSSTDSKKKAAVAKKSPKVTNAKAHNATKSHLRKKAVAVKRPTMEEDPTAYMGETSALNSYVARAAASDLGTLSLPSAATDDPSTASHDEQAAPRAPEHAPAAGSFMRWLDGESSKNGGKRKMGSSSKAQSPLDSINPEAKAEQVQPAESAEASIVAGVDELLKQAQAELGPVETEAPRSGEEQ